MNVCVQVRFMQEIKHPNLLTLYGAGSTHDGFAFLVMEYMAEGSLQALLADTTRPLPWTHRLTFGTDIVPCVCGAAEGWFLRNRCVCVRRVGAVATQASASTPRMRCGMRSGVGVWCAWCVRCAVCMECVLLWDFVHLVSNSGGMYKLCGVVGYGVCGVAGVCVWGGVMARDVWSDM